MAVLVLSAAITFILIALLAKILNSGRTNAKLPPGSLGLPIVGESFALINQNTRDFIAQRLVKYGPVFKTSLLGSKTVVLPAPEGNRLILLSENKLVRFSFPKSVTAILGEGSLISKTGEVHRRSKNHLMNFLRPEALQRLVGAASRMAQKHLDVHWKSKSSEILLVHPLVKRFMFSLACVLLMGFDDEDDERDLLETEFEVMKKGLFQLPIDLPGTPLRRAKSARRKLDQLLDKHVQKKRSDIASNKENGHDMLSMLLTTRDEDGELSSDSDIKDSIVTLLFAGHDTSSQALTWTFKYLAENPVCMDRVVEENSRLSKQNGELSWEDLRKLKYTWQAVQETMRMKAPVGVGFREAKEDVKFQNYVIPKGWKLVWSVVTSYNKEEFFENPLEFDPSRFDKDIVPFTYLPFGAGARMCPGLEFARMTMLVFLHHCVVNMRWSLVDGEEGVVSDPTPRPAKGMPIKLRIY